MLDPQTPNTKHRMLRMEKIVEMAVVTCVTRTVKWRAVKYEMTKYPATNDFGIDQYKLQNDNGELGQRHLIDQTTHQT